MNGRNRRAWRRIERALMGELPVKDRRELWVSLRGDAELRSRWDLAVEALRRFEGDKGVSETELALVEGWVLDDLAPEVAPSAHPWSRWSILFALAAAALVLLFVAPGPRPPEDPLWHARGGAMTGALTLQALCGPMDAPADALAGGAEPRCAIDDALGFAYRVRPDARGRRLTLFGIDGEGDPMYYAPTPDDARAIDVELGRWAAVEAGVKVEVNHAEGPLRVFGLLAPRAATLEEVQDFVGALAELPAARPGDAAWPQRIGNPALDGLCAAPSDCDAVELRLWIGAPTR